jgi:hypothetical protein
MGASDLLCLVYVLCGKFSCRLYGVLESVASVRGGLLNVSVSDISDTTVCC